MSDIVLGILIGVSVSVAVDVISLLVIRSSPRLRALLRERV